MAQNGPWKNRQGIEAFNGNGYTFSQMSSYNKDGKQLFHHTWFNPDNNRRISYDTYVSWGDHVYADGSGHEVNQRTNEVVDRWDGNQRYVRYDAYGNESQIVFGG